MNLLSRGIAVLLGLVAMATACLGADPEASPAIDPLKPITPFPSLVAFASARQIPLSGIALSDKAPPSHPGDTVTLLFTLYRDGRSRQWLVQVTEDDLTAAERAKPSPEAVIHTSTGQTFNYAHSPAALRVSFTGPFAASDPAAGSQSSPPQASKTGRALVNRESLRQGMSDYCRSALAISARIESIGLKEKDLFFSGGGAVPTPEIIEKGRRSAAQFGLTADEERLAFSVYFSLTTFFSAATEVAACREVIEEVIDKPSFWSIARNLGVRTDFNYLWTKVRLTSPPADVADPVYTLPVLLYLNGKPGVKATLAVTTPKPPLQTSAGIVALCAEHPKQPDRQLFVRVLSSRSGP